MFTIGDFAKFGQVSVRMLRHYDAIGLLRPAHVDPASGYRYYQAEQLSRLNRVIALKELGFTLNQVQSILDENVSAPQLRGMLRLRQAQLEEALAGAAERLAQVEARLRIIESEGTMSTNDIVVKSLPAVRLAELSAPAESFDPKDITPVISPLYDELFQRLHAAGVVPTGPGIAYYEGVAEGGPIVVHAGIQVGAEVAGVGDIPVVELPAVERAATIVHHGSMDNVLGTVQTLATWVEASGHRPTGSPRELYLSCPENRDEWVTELREPLL